MAKPVMSDTELKRRKKIQGEIGRTTSTLGLTSVGLLGASVAARKPGSKLYRPLKKVPGLKHADSPKKMGDKLKDASFGTSIAAGGIGGVGGFNQASIYSAESRKRQTVKKSDDDYDSPYFGEEGSAKRWEADLAEEIAKVGDWKTIDQRELTQTRARKTMRHAGAGMGLGAAALTFGHSRGGTNTLKHMKDVYHAGKIATGSAKDGLKAARKVGERGIKANPGGAGASIGGLALLGGSAAAGGSAKAGHTYNQHKINQRRKANYKREMKKAWTPSASKFDPEGQRMKRSDTYPKLLAATSGAAAAGASYKGLQAVKAGAKAKQHAAKLNKPKSSSTFRNLKTAQKSALKGGGKLVAVSAATGGAAVLAHRKKQSEGWKPYVSKSAFGVNHETDVTSRTN